MPEPVYLNATAKHCSAVMVERGQRVVRYQGEEYLMVGLYFARGNNGERELFYILRHSNGRDGQQPDGVGSAGLVPSWRGDGR
ncbi:MAG: hypothetical protein ACRDF5_03245 [bacterium]